MGKYSKYKNIFNLTSSDDADTADSLDSLDSFNLFPRLPVHALHGLNDQQQDMIKGIDAYLNNELDIPYFTVQGIGGSGKSFTIKRAIEHLPTSNIIFATPSHAAKNVLASFLGDKYVVMTVAKLLGMIMSVDKKTGEQILIKNRKIKIIPIETAPIIIIDEVSMINDSTANKILAYFKHSEHKKLILLGDYGQLPPVGQAEDSKFFNKISARLSIPMRFTGYIFELTSALRVEINKLRRDELADVNVINTYSNRTSRLDTNGSGYVFSKNRVAFLHLALSLFKQHVDTNYVRIIAYRNNTIDIINESIRLGLFGHGADKYMENEIVICDGGYSYTDSKGKIKPVLTNGEVLTVDTISENEGYLGINTLSITFKNKSTRYPVYVVAPTGKDKYTAELNILVSQAKNRKIRWEEVQKFKDRFAKLDYAYAVSSHKAQGSTIRHVFVFEEDILSVRPITLKEKLQSLYVGLSRAAYKLYILNSKYKPNQSYITKQLLLET
jgi:exodeoxyribonuclease-5